MIKNADSGYKFPAIRRTRNSVAAVPGSDPLTHIFELFRLSLLGEGSVSFFHLAYSIGFMIVIFPIALLLFNKSGNKLIDVI